MRLDRPAPNRVTQPTSTEQDATSESFHGLGHKRRVEVAGGTSRDHEYIGASASVLMALAGEAEGPKVAADWIGKMFMLGRLAEPWSRSRADSQLVIVLSVPVRDFAAVLVGCGWMSATPAPTLPPVREVLVGLSRGTPVRVVSKTSIFTERFGGIDARGLAHLGSQWQIDKLQAVAPLGSIDVPRKQPIPEPGVISRLAGLDKDWAARICSPPQDLALVGTLTRLNEDFAAQLGRGRELEPLANILLPAGPRAVTWSTLTYAASHLEEELPLTGLRGVVLDGAPATRFLSAIEAPVVVSVLDRSIADESVPEIVMNYRDTRGEPVSLRRDLNWTPPLGVEALAFEVPL